MFMLHKVFLFVLVLLGCMSEMLSAPVKVTEAVVPDAAKDVKAIDEKVRKKSNNSNLNSSLFDYDDYSDDCLFENIITVLISLFRMNPLRTRMSWIRKLLVTS